MEKMEGSTLEENASVNLGIEEESLEIGHISMDELMSEIRF